MNLQPPVFDVVGKINVYENNNYQYSIDITVENGKIISLEKTNSPGIDLKGNKNILKRMPPMRHPFLCYIIHIDVEE
mgnify:CR=1 FL=1